MKLQSVCVSALQKPSTQHPNVLLTIIDINSFVYCKANRGAQSKLTSSCINHFLTKINWKLCCRWKGRQMPSASQPKGTFGCRGERREIALSLYCWDLSLSESVLCIVPLPSYMLLTCCKVIVLKIPDEGHCGLCPLQKQYLKPCYIHCKY